MALEPPPRIVDKFTHIWRDWLYFLWEFIGDHTGGGAPIPPATGTSWNAHGNTAIGDASTPLIVDEGTFQVKGTAGTTPADLDSGPGMAFIQSKAAFRVGEVPDFGGYWNDGSIGANSIGIGENVWPTGANSIAIGKETYATAADAIAIGKNGLSSGVVGSLSIGLNAQSTNPNAIGIGNFVIGSSSNAIAMGTRSTASGLKSLAVGNFVEASGTDGFTIGTGVGLGNELVNPNDRTLWVALESDVPTIVMVNATGGVGTTGFVGIIEQVPLSTLDIGGSVGFKYTNIAGSNGGSDALSDEYTIRVDISSMTGSNVHTLTLPALGAATIDRRIYYVKVVNKTGGATARNAIVELDPDASDQVEDWGFFAVNDGELLPAGTPLQLILGDGVTIIANNTDGAWWVL